MKVSAQLKKLLYVPLVCYLGFLSLILLDAPRLTWSAKYVIAPFYAFYNILSDAECIPVAWPCLLCCILFGWLWWTGYGIKRTIYYILLLGFSLFMSYGTLLYAARDVRMPGDGGWPHVNTTPYFVIWASFIAIILAKELYSRFAVKK